jgi:hypothetical protein
MSGIEVTAEAKPDIEIGVLQQRACEGQSGKDRDPAGEQKLEIEKCLGVRGEQHEQNVARSPAARQERAHGR